jgi:hypothetical protein
VSESFNPWSIVNLVFHHLAAQGLHPILGESGDPGEPAAELLRRLGIFPDVQGDQRIAQGVQENLATLRDAVFPTDSDAAERDDSDDVDRPGDAVFHVETAGRPTPGLYPHDSDDR